MVWQLAYAEDGLPWTTPLGPDFDRRDLWGGGHRESTRSADRRLRGAKRNLMPRHRT